jgi:hypothetical protein
MQNLGQAVGTFVVELEEKEVALIEGTRVAVVNPL